MPTEGLVEESREEQALLQKSYVHRYIADVPINSMPVRTWKTECRIFDLKKLCNTSQLLLLYSTYVYVCL